MQLNGAVAVVTGASAGIGEATALALADRGTKVVLAARRLERLEALAATIEGRGGTAVAVRCDVADADQVASLPRVVKEAFGRTDILVNNAGVPGGGDFTELGFEEIRKVVEINLLGAWTTTAAAMPHLLRSRGHIVNVASGLAIVAMPYAAAYSASKRGLAAYSDSVRLEYRGRVTVTTVYPGYVRTPIHEGPAAQGVALEGLVNADTVEQAAAALVRACSHRPRELTTSRTTALSLAIARHLPRVVEAVVARRMESARRRGRIEPSFLR